MPTEETAPTIWETLQSLASSQLNLYILGGALLVVFLLILFMRRQPKRVTAYITENGRVLVSRSAIVELVQTACQQLNDVSKPRVKLVVKRNVTNLDVEIKLLSGGRLRTIEDTLQGHLRSALSENLGIENLGYINIVATGFKSGRIDTSATTKRLADPTLDEMEEAVDVIESPEAEPPSETQK
ncbi:MAG: alkaline shock response membrane anchor protein AmaP [Opitutaceae bacterium]